MRLGADELSWRWIDPQGREQSGVKWDLVALLSSGELPATTLVWRTGWAEWFAANSIAELSDALPLDAITARLSPPASKGILKPPPPPTTDSRASLIDAAWGSAPPPPPVPPPKPGVAPKPHQSATTNLKKTGAAAPPKQKAASEKASSNVSAHASPTAEPRANAANLKLPRPNLTPPKIVLPSERKSAPHNDAPARGKERDARPSSFGLVGGQKGRPPIAVVSTHSATFPPFERPTKSYEGYRPPQPTLSDEVAPSATTTLRPPAAVPPPPRSALSGPMLDARVLSRLGREASAVDTPLPAPSSEAALTVPKPELKERVTTDDSVATLRKEALSSTPWAAPAREAHASPSADVVGEARAPQPTLSEAAPGASLGPRAPQPTLSEAAPGASLGPRAPQPTLAEAVPVGSRPLPPLHAPPLVEPGRPLVPPPPRRTLADPAAPVPPSARPVVKPVSSLDATLPSEPASAKEPAPMGSPKPDEGDAQARTGPHPTEPRRVRRLQPVWLAVAGAAVGSALVGAFVFTSQRGEATAPEMSNVPAAAPPPPPVTAPPSCRIEAHPARLGAAIERSVTPLFAPLGPDRAAVGFAETRKKATGLVITPSTLDAQPAFKKGAEQALRSVVPLVASGKESFSALTDSEALKQPRAVDGAKPFVLGVGEDALVRAVGDDPPSALWSLPPKTALSELRVASNARGHLVTFRLGGLNGKEMVGFLNPSGDRQSELEALDAPKLVGAPFAALGAEHWVVAFAARDSAEEPWHVELVTGAFGDPRGTRKRFEAPPGGLGGGQIAPSIAPIDRGHWLLQWTEGQPGTYQVRALVLDPKLDPSGDVLVVSPKGASSGQGALYFAGERAVSLYIQTIGGHDELWATTLNCR